MNAARHTLRQTGRRLIPLWIGIALPGLLEAQVGLGSSLAEVQLVARVLPRGTLESVGPQVETDRQGSMREVSVKVEVSANTSYRLVVHRTDGAAGSAGAVIPMRVRGLDGEFRPFDAAGPVLVDRGGHAAGQWEREVRYQVEGGDPSAALPVRYDVVIDPTL